MPEERSVSRTALGVALLRAAHLILDEPPFILEDRPAFALLGADVTARIQGDAERLQQPSARGLRSHVLLRSRFAEDSLHDAVDRGVRDFVVLGAGFDTFVVRQPSWAAPLRIVEIDQIATQREKRRRLADAGFNEPPNVEWIVADFEQQTMDDVLASAQLGGRSTFFSWLGVSSYLEDATVRGVLASVARTGAGAEIAMTFSQPRGEDDPNRLGEMVATLGEPFKSHATVEQMDAMLREAGFDEIEFLWPDDANARYFADRTDGLTAPRRTSIVRARRTA